MPSGTCTSSSSTTTPCWCGTTSSSASTAVFLEERRLDGSPVTVALPTAASGGSGSVRFGSAATAVSCPIERAEHDRAARAVHPARRLDVDLERDHVTIQAEATGSWDARSPSRDLARPSARRRVRLPRSHSRATVPSSSRRQGRRSRSQAARRLFHPA